MKQSLVIIGFLLCFQISFAQSAADDAERVRKSADSEAKAYEHMMRNQTPAARSAYESAKRTTKTMKKIHTSPRSSSSGSSSSGYTPMDMNQVYQMQTEMMMHDNEVQIAKNEQKRRQRNNLLYGIVGAAVLLVLASCLYRRKKNGKGLHLHNIVDEVKEELDNINYDNVTEGAKDAAKDFKESEIAQKLKKSLNSETVKSNLNKAKDIILEVKDNEKVNKIIENVKTSEFAENVKKSFDNIKNDKQVKETVEKLKGIDYKKIFNKIISVLIDIIRIVLKIVVWIIELLWKLMIQIFHYVFTNKKLAKNSQ